MLKSREQCLFLLISNVGPHDEDHIDLLALARSDGLSSQYPGTTLYLYGVNGDEVTSKNTYHACVDAVILNTSPAAPRLAYKPIGS